MVLPPTYRRRRGRAAARVAALVAATMLAVLAAACAEDGSDDPGLFEPGDSMPTGITVTSTSFDPGHPVPERFSCEGDNVPPPLSWTGVPPGTSELALAIEDPDAPDGTFVHWLVVGIDPGSTGLRGTGPPGGGEVLPGSSDNATYIGPCPPNDDGIHRYLFEVYALREPPALGTVTTPVAKVRAIRRAAAAGGLLIGTFTR